MFDKSFSPNFVRAVAIAVCVLNSGWLPAAEKQNRLLNIQDVALQAEGILQGVLVDQQGLPIKNSPVVVVFRNEPIVKMRTDDRGVFRARGLRAGLHTIQAPSALQRCRLWTAAAAPPRAKRHIVLVHDDQLVRAQWGMMYSIDPLQTVLAAGAITGLILALDYNDSEPNRSMPPASP